MRANGRVPATWGPDVADQDGDDDEDWHEEDEKPGTSWLRLAAVLASIVILVLGIVFAFNLGRGSGGLTASETPSGSGSASSAAPDSKPVPIAGVTDFDPLGDPPQENPELAPLAADGKAATAWRTSTYYDEFPRLKAGVGLLVDLGKPAEVGSVRVNLLGDGTSLDILAAPDAQAAPSSTDGLDTVASAKNAGGRADLELKKPVTTQWLVVWLTAPAERARRVPGPGRGDLRLVMTGDRLPRGPTTGRCCGRTSTGDPDAFGTLFARHRDRLWAVALRTTGDPEEAADALQDALIAAFRRADSYRGDAAVTTWLHRIVVNACLDRLRRRKVRLADPLPDDLDERAAGGRRCRAGRRPSSTRPTSRSTTNGAPPCSPRWPRCRWTSGPRWCWSTWRGTPSRRPPRSCTAPRAP